MAHLLCEKWTFISNRGGQKLAQNQNFSLFRYDLRTKMFLKMGPNWFFRAKFLLGTTTSTHLLYKNWTFLSNQGWQKNTTKKENFTFSVWSYNKMFLKIGLNGVFSAKFLLGPMKSTYLLYKKWTLLVTQGGQNERVYFSRSVFQYDRALKIFIKMVFEC